MASVLSDMEHPAQPIGFADTENDTVRFKENGIVRFLVTNRNSPAVLTPKKIAADQTR